ncbi:hypothetical protein DPMN_157941 [Dreissena polymorpha]|uniref:G-protein coupled receptors family 1 profile domain-containing protein n=1 Tax=Dreissena polymorpha TaxID=45954 RepID=A0A9D4EKF2_DREPO|nr:hypothetical protein DPMN_157941 [Dreissena polymorpha]
MSAGITEFDVRLNNNTTLSGRHCMNSDVGENKLLLKYFSMIKVAIVTIASLMLIVMYVLIARQVKSSKPDDETYDSHNEDTMHSHCANYIHSADGNTSTDDIETSVSPQTQPSSNHSISVRNVREINRTGLRLRNQRLRRRITLMVFVMVFVSMLSLCPNTIIKMASSLHRYEYPMWLALLYYTYVLNSCINPFIIGCCNASFRKFVKSILCILCRKFIK